MTDLSQFSLLVVYAAMASYTIALVAFAIDLSSLRARRDSEGRVIREHALVGVRTGGTAGDGGAVAVPAPGRRRAAGIAMSTTLLGAAFHGIGVVSRALAAGHVPWSNMYEFTLTFTFVAVGLYLWLAHSHDLRYLGAFVVGPVLLLLGVAVAVLYVAAEGLQPILDNYWLYLHVSVATVAIAVLGLAAVLAVLQLAKDLAGDSRWVAILSGLPGAAELEEALLPVHRRRLRAVDLHPGGRRHLGRARVGARLGVGRQGGVDVRHLGHLRRLPARPRHPRLDGRRAAYLVIAGFAAIMANYFVVNFLLSTKHGYAF